MSLKDKRSLPRKRMTKCRRALLNTLCKMLGAVSLHEITVPELTALSKVNRTTFYANYVDIFDFYKRTQADIINALEELLLKTAAFKHSSMYALIVDYLYNNRLPARVLFSEKTSCLEFRAYVYDKLLNYYVRYCAHTIPFMSVDNRIEFFISYHIYSSISLLDIWVSENFALSREEILDIFNDMNRSLETLIVSTLSVDRRF